jgi:hypothetical protein
MKPPNGSGAEALVADSPGRGMLLQDWSPDGRWLVYYDIDQSNGRDLFALDTASPDHPRRAIANTPAEEVLAALSPDGRWVAYQTNESGRFEVVVQPFPDSGGKWQVSMAGGVAPRWRADGKELYFLAPDATLMAVPVTAAGPSLEAGAPVALFPTRIVDGGTHQRRSRSCGRRETRRDRPPRRCGAARCRRSRPWGVPRAWAYRLPGRAPRCACRRAIRQTSLERPRHRRPPALRTPVAPAGGSRAMASSRRWPRLRRARQAPQRPTARARVSPGGTRTAAALATASSLPTLSISSRTARAESRRRVRSRSTHLRSRRLIVAGVCTGRADQSGSFVRMCASVSATSSPTNGRTPVSIS